MKLSVKPIDIQFNESTYYISEEILNKRLERQEREDRRQNPRFKISYNITIAMNKMFKVKEVKEKRKHKYERTFTEAQKKSRREKAIEKYYENLEENRKKARDNYEKNKEQITILRNINNYNIKTEVLSHYSNGKLECKCCKEPNINNLTIDHINGGGKEHRKKIKSGRNFYSWLKRNGYPDGYQVLCFYCNSKKGSRNTCNCKQINTT